MNLQENAEKNTSENEYTMKISKLTIDKLGVKLYDKVSAAIAELVANSYDADAKKVTVSAPMNKLLAKKQGGALHDLNFEIKIEDDGIGMTPKQMQDFFLIVGAERRNNPKQGAESKCFGRKVMGRKGVGKLAPFGICRIMEVISSGDERTKKQKNGGEEERYLTSHIILDYEDMIDDTNKDEYHPETGPLNRTLRNNRGTTIILRDFNHRRVPKIDTLSRQIAQRFGIKSKNWEIVLEDNNPSAANGKHPQVVGEFDVPKMDNTLIRFDPDAEADFRVIGPDGKPISDLHPGFYHDKEFYGVKGWVAYAKTPYKDDLMAGVRIYCRGKIAAQTAIFNKSAGFRGEHNVRSYLVGELHADWLDEKEDLIQTDRRDIMWSDELCAAFEEWGQKIVLRIGKLSRDPMRKTVKELFFKTGRVKERIQERYPSEDDEAITQKALYLSEMFGKSISRAEAENEEVVKPLVDLSILIAPTVTLDDAMSKATEKNQTTLTAIISLLRTARIAELSSFGKVAEQRIEVIKRLEELKNDKNTKELQLQKLIEDAPWLINPEWAPVTKNQTLETLRREFENYYEEKTGKSISLSDFDNPDKKPDFVLLNHDNRAQIVEIKRPKHELTNEEMDRIIEYHNLMKKFLKDPSHADFRKKIANDFTITLVCDEIKLTGAQEGAYDGYESQKKLTRVRWSSFLLRVKEAHSDFLEVARKNLKQLSQKEKKQPRL